MYFDDDDNEEQEYSFQDELNRFERFLLGDELGFMDSDAYEYILDQYLIQGHYAKANTCADIAIDQFPFIYQFSLRKAQAVSAMGNLKEALTLIYALERKIEPGCELFLTKASIFSQLRDSKTAVKYFLEALSVSDPEDKDEIYIDLAMEYEQLRDFPAAIKILKDALKFNPENEVANYELAFCYDQMGEFEQAIVCYNSFIDENPYSFTAWYNLGNAYSKLGQLDNAIWAYEYCVLINEKFAPVYFNLGNTYLSLDKFKAATLQFEKCIELDGEDAVTLCYMGECYEQLDQLDLAKHYYYQSIEFLPEMADAWLGLGIVMDLEGNTKEGIKFIQNAIDIEPLNAGYHQVLAGAYDKAGMEDESNESYLTAFSLDSNDRELFIEYIDFLVNRGFIKDAISFIKTFDSEMEDVDFLKELMLVHIEYFNVDSDAALRRLEACVLVNLDAAYELFLLYPKLNNESKILHLYPN